MLMTGGLYSDRNNRVTLEGLLYELWIYGGSAKVKDFEQLYDTFDMVGLKDAIAKGIKRKRLKLVGGRLIKLLLEDEA